MFSISRLALFTATLTSAVLAAVFAPAQTAQAHGYHYHYSHHSYRTYSMGYDSRGTLGASYSRPPAFYQTQTFSGPAYIGPSGYGSYVQNYAVTATPPEPAQELHATAMSLPSVPAAARSSR